MKIGTFWFNRLGLHNFKLFLRNTNWKNRLPIALFILGKKEKVDFLGYEFRGENKRWLLRHILGLEGINNEEIIWLTEYLRSIFDEEKYFEFGPFKFKQLDSFLFKEIFLNKEYDVKGTKYGDVILDIGANVGDTALYFAWKGYKVKAFEPISETANIALTNINLNPELAENIELFNHAVGAKKSKMNIGIHETNSGENSSRIKSENFETVNVLPIEEIIEKYNPSIIKMDCEGCEEAIIRISKFHGVSELFIEVHDWLGVNKKEIRNLLKENNFDIEENFNTFHCRRRLF